jgi:periplasmic copper chaperone A
MKIRNFVGLFFVLILVVLLSSCIGPKTAPNIAIENSWGRPSPTMPTAGGLYMLVKNTGDAPDRLLSGKSPACGSIEVHEMVKKTDGTMGMNLVDKPVEIPAGGQVEFKVGDLHIMCIMRNDDQFKPGQKIDLTLTFEKSGDKTVLAEIKAE